MNNANPQPIVRMQDDSSGASVINYNVPEPTTYSGNMYFELDLQKLLQDLLAGDDPIPTSHSGSGTRGRNWDWKKLFTDFNRLPFAGRQKAIEQLLSIDIEKIAGEVEKILNYGCNYKKTNSSQTVISVSSFIYLPSEFEGLVKIGRSVYDEIYDQSISTSQHLELTNSENTVALNRLAQPSQPIFDFRKSLIFKRYQKLIGINSANSITFSSIAEKLVEGNFFVVFKRFSGQYDYKFVSIPEVIKPSIFIIEKYKLSSFLGNYGAGRTIKTFSLLPGEKMKISVKTFKKSTIETKVSTSILDSYSQESADDFEDTLSREQTRKSESQEKLAWHAEAEGSLDLGIIGGGGGGGASGEDTSQRENLAKSVSEAVTNHSQSASSQRDINIDTSYERKEETGEETSIEREIENINVSRTLNFVFRQMNQEYLTLLHLVDATIGYTSGLPGSFIQGTVSNLDSFLSNIIVKNNPATIEKIKESVVDHLCMIVNYDDKKVTFLEPKEFDIEHPLYPPKRLKAKYIRVKKDLKDEYKNPSSNLEKEVPGIIVSAQLNVMRTEGVFVEALLGQGDALDKYSHGLQDETVREKQVENDLKAKEAEKIGLANSIIANNETDKAKLFEQIYPCCPEIVCNCDKSKLASTSNGNS